MLAEHGPARLPPVGEVRYRRGHTGLVIVTVLVKPGSRKGPLVEEAADGMLVVYVREPAIEGRATAAARDVLARHFGVAKRRVTLVAGATSRHKRFRISA